MRGRHNHHNEFGVALPPTRATRPHPEPESSKNLFRQQCVVNTKRVVKRGEHGTNYRDEHNFSTSLIRKIAHGPALTSAWFVLSKGTAYQVNATAKTTA